MKLRDVEAFLARPLGGLEMETFIAVHEGIYGCALVFGGQIIPHVLPSGIRVLCGALFLLSVLVTSVGLWCFANGNPMCSPLRWIGSTMSVLIWTVLATQVPSAALTMICLSYALAQTRLVGAAHMRPWPTR